jgi:hypothetical protein
VALAFPEIYEIAQSHLGLQILYDLLNRRPDVAAERAYAPWGDLEALLRARGLPLVSLESHLPLRDFHVVGFSLQYELTYTNLLNMLELGGIPLRAADRRPTDPLIIAGGPCAFNPEPLAPFLDAVVLGDGEEVVGEIVDAVATWDGRDRTALLRAVAGISGCYVPAFFAPRHHDDGTIAEVTPLDPERPQVRKRVLPDLDRSRFRFLEIQIGGVSNDSRGKIRLGYALPRAGDLHSPVSHTQLTAVLDRRPQAVGQRTGKRWNVANRNHVGRRTDINPDRQVKRGNGNCRTPLRCVPKSLTLRQLHFRSKHLFAFDSPLFLQLSGHIQVVVGAANGFFRDSSHRFGAQDLVVGDGDVVCYGLVRPLSLQLRNLDPQFGLIVPTASAYKVADQPLHPQVGHSKA